MRRRLTRLATVATALLGFCYLPYSAGAIIKASCDGLTVEGKQAACQILFSGPIESGDAARLLELFRRSPQVGTTYIALVLDSPGGDVDEALRISEIVKSTLLHTQLYTHNELRAYLTGVRGIGKPNAVGMKRRCASACVLIWIAGPEHSAFEGQLGLHRPYFAKAAYGHSNPVEISRQQNRIMRLTRDYLLQEGMPSQLVEKMLQHSSQEVHWVTESETNSIPYMAAWWNEMLIARCGQKSRNETILLDESFNRDPFNEKWKKAIEKEAEDKLRVLRCGKDLQFAAQQKIRQQSSR